jgi:dsRNA-specific ribonuclease
MRKAIITKLDNGAIKLSPKEKQVRDNIVDFVHKNWEQAQVLFESVAAEDPKEALKVLMALTEFVSPKYSRVKAPDLEEKPTDIVVTFRRDDLIDSKPE